MRRFILVVSVIVAAFAPSAIAPALAAAELPEFTVATTFTGTTGKFILEGTSKTSVICSKGTSSGELKGHEGTVALTLGECKEGKVSCRSESGKGEKDPIETILMSGTLASVVATGLPSEAGMLLLLNETLVNCGVVKATVAGAGVAGIAPFEAAATKFTLKLKQKEGKQEPSEYFDEADELVKTEKATLVNFGKGAEAAGVEAVEASFTTGKTTELKFANFPTVTVNTTSVDLEMLNVGEKKTASFTYEVAAGSVRWFPTTRSIAP